MQVPAFLKNSKVISIILCLILFAALWFFTTWEWYFKALFPALFLIALLYEQTRDENARAEPDEIIKRALETPTGKTGNYGLNPAAAQGGDVINWKDYKIEIAFDQDNMAYLFYYADGIKADGNGRLLGIDGRKYSQENPVFRFEVSGGLPDKKKMREISPMSPKEGLEKVLNGISQWSSQIKQMQGMNLPEEE